MYFGWTFTANVLGVIDPRKKSAAITRIAYLSENAFTILVKISSMIFIFGSTSLLRYFPFVILLKVAYGIQLSRCKLILLINKLDNHLYKISPLIELLILKHGTLKKKCNTNHLYNIYKYQSGTNIKI